MRLLVGLALLSVGAGASAGPLLFYNGRLFIPVRINRVATEALLDSGAEATLVDPVLAAKAKLPEGTPQTIRGSAGSAFARIVEGATIGALGLELHPDAIVVTDLSSLSKRLIKRPTRAVVGRELFDAARLRIDISAGRISVVNKNAPPPGQRLPLAAHAGIESIPVRVNGTVVQAEFDLGNGTDVLISRAVVNRLKLRILGRKTGGGIGGGVVRDLVRIKSLDLGGLHLRDVPAAIDDQSNAGELNVGTSVLKHFLITVDFAGQSVWLQPKRS